jgi:hypothetical protein
LDRHILNALWRVLDATGGHSETERLALAWMWREHLPREITYAESSALNHARSLLARNTPYRREDKTRPGRMIFSGPTPAGNRTAILPLTLYRERDTQRLSRAHWQDLARAILLYGEILLANADVALAPDRREFIRGQLRGLTDAIMTSKLWPAATTVYPNDSAAAEFLDRTRRLIITYHGNFEERDVPLTDGRSLAEAPRLGAWLKGAVPMHQAPREDIIALYRKMAPPGPVQFP